MKSISFDNPYLLLLIIPVVLVLLVSFFVAIKKDGRGRDVVSSLVLHIVITVLVGIAAAGMTYTAVITETEVVVVADVSYSANDEEKTIDDRIAEIKDSLFGNTKLAVVTFGKDYRLHTAFGESLSAVTDEGVDTSDTDIASALDYAATLFSKNSIKRVVLITDGNSTGEDGDSRLVQSVDNLFAMDVRVDAIYLESGLESGEKEVQVSSVSFTKDTYRGHASSADVLVNSSYAGRAILTLYRDGEVLSVRTEQLTEGFNIINFELPTDTDGSFNYRVEVSAENDTTRQNNSCSFTQRVSGEVRILLVTGKSTSASAGGVSDEAREIDMLRQLVGEDATIDVYNSTKRKNSFDLPYTVQELVKYDEILLSDVDILSLPNYSEFINSLDTVVSEFGKSLVTFGNNNIQNKSEDALKKMENMLPVNYGNNEREAKLVTLIVDCSKSMNTAGRLITAKEVCYDIIDLLEPEDRVAVIAFHGDFYTASNPTPVSSKAELFETIKNLDAKQGTVIGAALDGAYDLMRDLDYSKKQAILISDGLSYVKVSEDDTALSSARNMYASGIVVSTINMWTVEQDGIDLMEGVAAAGGGTAYFIENEKDYEGKISTQFADEITESVVLGTTAVDVLLEKDDSLLGVGELPTIEGYTFAKLKPNATTVLRVQWERNKDSFVDVPLYAYWNYGNGRVSTFTSQLSGEWTDGWGADDGKVFFTNVMSTATPEQRQDYPFNLNITESGSFTRVELIPAAVNLDAVANITLTLPDGEAVVYSMVFDSAKYYCTLPTAELGEYDVHVEYSYSGKSYSADTAINVSYSREYDRFDVFTDTVLYNAIRNRGEVVSSDRIPSYEYDETELARYVVSFTVPFLIAAIALYVIDIIIRKLKWSDIKGLFRRVKRG